MLQCVAACCSVLQRVAVCCSVLQCAAMVDEMEAMSKEWVAVNVYEQQNVSVHEQLEVRISRVYPFICALQISSVFGNSDLE